MSGMFEPKADGAKRREARALQEAKSRRKTRIIMISVVTVLALLFAAALLINSKYIRRTLPVLTIDGVSFTTVDYEYFFNAEYVEYMNLMSQMQGMGGLGGSLPDDNKPLSSQIYDPDTGETWADFFSEMTLRRMSMMVQLYNAAMTAGFRLTDERTAEIDENMANVRMQAESYGFPSTESFLQRMYGNSIDEKSFRSVLEFIVTAEAYSEHVRESFDYSAEDIKGYYDANKDSLDIFSYRTFVVFPEHVEPTEYPNTEEYLAAVEEKKAEANAIAVEIAAGIESEDDFLAAAMEYEVLYSDPDSTLRTMQGDRLDNDLGPWLLEETREHGDTDIIDTEQGSTVIFFVSRDNNSYQLAGMRQILIMRESIDPQEYENGEDDPAYIAAFEQANREIRERAELAYSLFVAGGETEAALIGLIEEYSADDTEGGYYDNISKYPYQSAYVSAMKVVPEIEDWLFDENREVGDSELIYTEAYGYHLLYFTGYGKQFCDLIADDKLRTDAHNAWREGLADVKPPVKHRAFVLVQL